MALAQSSSAKLIESSHYASRVEIFSVFDPQEMSRIAAYARSLRKARGEFIYLPGESADFVYILRRRRSPTSRM